MKFTPLVALFAASFFFTGCSTVSGTPSPGVQKVQDVYTPPVIKPSGGEILAVGQTYRVVWDNSSPPSQITNPFGVIKLRRGNYTMRGSLTGGFSILQGSAQIVIPDVPESDDYRIVLFGDSGNWSAAFRIVAKRGIASHCKD